MHLTVHISVPVSDSANDGDLVEYRHGETHTGHIDPAELSVLASLTGDEDEGPEFIFNGYVLTASHITIKMRKDEEGAFALAAEIYAMRHEAYPG